MKEFIDKQAQTLHEKKQAATRIHIERSLTNIIYFTEGDHHLAAEARTTALRDMIELRKALIPYENTSYEYDIFYGPRVKPSPADAPVADTNALDLEQTIVTIKRNMRDIRDYAYSYKSLDKEAKQTEGWIQLLYKQQGEQASPRDVKQEVFNALDAVGIHVFGSEDQKAPLSIAGEPIFLPMKGETNTVFRGRAKVLNPTRSFELDGGGE